MYLLNNRATVYMVQYTFVEKTDIDNEKLLVGGYPLSAMLSMQEMGHGPELLGGGAPTGINTLYLNNYAIPAGLVLMTSLYAENPMYGGGGGGSKTLVSPNSLLMDDSLFDTLFGLAAFKVGSPVRHSKTAKKRAVMSIMT